jgi:hypothetical protein
VRAQAGQHVMKDPALKDLGLRLAGREDEVVEALFVNP